ncbi:MAG: cardiolipin synthase, partial [Treponema sp.]|nr:cardiolipin synthase [Treponema sp.]
KAIFDFMRMFLEVWNIGEKKKDNYADFLNLDYKAARTDGLVIPYGDHAFNDEDIAENVYLDIISNAKKYLYITTPYVVIDNQFLSTLTFAAKRGVDVRVAVPSKPDHLATFCVGKTFLKNLIDNGVKVYIYKKGFLHAKTVLADGKIATVGSVNLDYRSFYAHFECGAIMYGSSILSDIKKDFDSMFENDCEEMHLADYKALPWYVRSTGRVIRIFGPLM